MQKIICTTEDVLLLRIYKKVTIFFFGGGGVTFILNCSYDLYTNFDI